jgi:shikimate dehydrogenase
MPGRLVLLGHPVSHSLSPVFQQAALDHLGIALRYEAVDVREDEFDAVLAGLRAECAAGNVTLPHKRRMARHCATLSALAQRASAANVFWSDADGALHGDNTDVGGFLAAARGLLGRDLSGLRVLMLGAGGAAAGVVAAMQEIPEASLIVHARKPEAAAELVEPLGQLGRATDGTSEALIVALASTDLVVNATSLGIEGSDELPLAPALLPQSVSALDLTYRRGGLTPWVAALRAKGRSADDGLTMLLEQGALAFERWFGIEAPREVMARAIGR